MMLAMKNRKPLDYLKAVKMVLQMQDLALSVILVVGKARLWGLLLTIFHK